MDAVDPRVADRSPPAAVLHVHDGYDQRRPRVERGATSAQNSGWPGSPESRRNTRSEPCTPTSVNCPVDNAFW